MILNAQGYQMSDFTVLAYRDECTVLFCVRLLPLMQRERAPSALCIPWSPRSKIKYKESFADTGSSRLTPEAKGRSNLGRKNNGS